jgi:hypothetical protein
VIAPVAKEAVGGPSTSRLDNVQRHSQRKQLCRTADAEAMSSNATKTKVCRNPVHLCEEDPLDKRLEYSIDGVTKRRGACRRVAGSEHSCHGRYRAGPAAGLQR